MDSLDTPLDIVVYPPFSSFPEAVVYFRIKERLELMDLSTPIFDSM